MSDPIDNADGNSREALVARLRNVTRRIHQLIADGKDPSAALQAEQRKLELQIMAFDGDGVMVADVES